jgi:hypothetical protein
MAIITGMNSLKHFLTTYGLAGTLLNSKTSTTNKQKK